MKLTINITDKVKEITVEEDVNLSSLVLFLETAFPEFWKEFKIVKQVSYKNYPYLTTSPYIGSPTWTTLGNPGTGTLMFDPQTTTATTIATTAAWYSQATPSQVDYQGQSLNLEEGLYEVNVPS